MTAPIVIQFASVEALEREFENNLRHGGTFASGVSGFVQTDDCTVAIVHPTSKARLTLPAQIALVVPDQGVGIALAEFNPTVRETLADFVKNGNAPGDEKQSPSMTENVYARLRGLSPVEARKVAAGHKMDERVVAERIYGKAVWDTLLKNSRITIPEVSRIARMGAIPRPLLEQIVSNNTWLNAPHIRRALLSNPRLSGEMIMKVLRITPRNELRMVAKQTTYSSQIRSAARKLLG